MASASDPSFLRMPPRGAAHTISSIAIVSPFERSVLAAALLCRRLRMRALRHLVEVGEPLVQPPGQEPLNVPSCMLHAMKVVQTQLSETEYRLLAAYAAARKKTIKEVAREAIRQAILRDEVDPDDPIFRAFPLTQKKARITDGSERADYYLYGWDR